MNLVTFSDVYPVATHEPRITDEDKPLESKEERTKGFGEKANYRNCVTIQQCSKMYYVLISVVCK